MLKAELAGIEYAKAQMRRAAAELTDRILRTGQPTLKGHLDRPSGEFNRGARPETIPARCVLIDPVMTLTDLGRVALDTSLPRAVWEPRIGRGPTWSNVYLYTNEVEVHWPPPTTVSTVAGERRLASYILEYIISAPNAPPGKDIVRQRAEKAGHKVSDNGFERSFRAALEAAKAAGIGHDWSKRGPKKPRYLVSAS